MLEHVGRLDRIQTGPRSERQEMQLSTVHKHATGIRVLMVTALAGGLLGIAAPAQAAVYGCAVS